MATALERTLQHKILSRANVDENTTYTYLKLKQVETAVAPLGGDTLSVLPTAYKKTVVFQMLPYTTGDGVIVVVNPLNAIIEEQRQRFGDRCIVVDESLLKQLDDKPELRDVRFIIGHPEFLTDDRMKSFFRDSPLSEKVINLRIFNSKLIYVYLGLIQYEDTVLPIQEFQLWR